jgi:hypothetical protein
MFGHQIKPIVRKRADKANMYTRKIKGGRMGTKMTIAECAVRLYERLKLLKDPMKVRDIEEREMLWRELREIEKDFIGKLEPRDLESGRSLITDFIKHWHYKYEYCDYGKE